MKCRSQVQVTESIGEAERMREKKEEGDETAEWGAYITEHQQYPILECVKVRAREEQKVPRWSNSHGMVQLGEMKYPEWKKERERENV